MRGRECRGGEGRAGDGRDGKVGDGRRREGMDRIEGRGEQGEALRYYRFIDGFILGVQFGGGLFSFSIGGALT